MLDAIISPDWQFRYYSFDAHWNAGEEMASMRNGSGDDWFLLFAPYGAALKGFGHESAFARKSTFSKCIQQTLPGSFTSFLQEPAFNMDKATFCLWRRHSDPEWNVVLPADDCLAADKDGSREMLGILDGKPQTYQAWAEDYYERGVSLAAVHAIYRHSPLNLSLLAALNLELIPADIQSDATGIGYPSP